jgi:hypothetical protein
MWMVFNEWENPPYSEGPPNPVSNRSGLWVGRIIAEASNAELDHTVSQSARFETQEVGRPLFPLNFPIGFFQDL